MFTSLFFISQVCVHNFAIPTFESGGMVGDAFCLLIDGLENYNPLEWSSTSSESFLRYVFPDDEYPTSAFWDDAW